MQGKKLMVERFNIIHQLNNGQEEENKFLKHGMVLGILE
jgi:hypothetical protein